jgi:hypothetical protein
MVRPRGADSVPAASLSQTALSNAVWQELRATPITLIVIDCSDWLHWQTAIADKTNASGKWYWEQWQGEIGAMVV